MQHIAEVHTSPSSVTLLTSMRPALWKKVLFGCFVVFLVAIPFAVALLTGTAESGKEAVLPVIGFMAMIILWPGLSLLWNVKGEEMIEASTSALRVRQNWGLFQTPPKTLPFQGLHVVAKPVRTIGTVAYQTFDCWSRDENGFDKHLFSSAIPVPASEIRTFLEALGLLFEPMGHLEGDLPPISPN